MTSAELNARIKKQPIGVACAFICLLSGGWLYYRSGAIAIKQAEYEAKAAEAARIISNVGISKNLPEQTAELQALTKDLESRLVRASQLAVNLQYFYKLEADTEVKLVDVRQNPVPRGPARSLYVGIPYSVNLEGNFKQVLSFLQGLENGRHFCRITGATFNKTGGAGNPGMTLSLNLELLGQP